MSALHTASAALSFVPPSAWNAETHRFNISSYDGSAALPTEVGGDEKSRVAGDKAFKKELYHYLRWALSAGAPGPGIPETMEILGRDETVRRLREAREASQEPVSDAPGRRQEDRAWMGSLGS